MPFGSVLLYPRRIAACLSTLTLLLACFLNFLMARFLFHATYIVLSSALEYSSALPP